MNERIRELAEEAWPNLDNDPRMIFSSVDVKRFAKLIIKECADVANASIDPAESYLIGNDILKHFGVEE